MERKLLAIEGYGAQCAEMSSETVRFVEVPTSGTLGVYVIGIGGGKTAFFVIDDNQRNRVEEDWKVVEAYLEVHFPEAWRFKSSGKSENWSNGYYILDWYADLSINEFCEKFSDHYPKERVGRLAEEIRSTVFIESVLSELRMFPSELKNDDLDHIKQSQLVREVAARLGISVYDGPPQAEWPTVTRKLRGALGGKAVEPHNRLAGVASMLNSHQAVLYRLANEYGILLDADNSAESDFDLGVDDWREWDKAQCSLQAIRDVCDVIGIVATRDDEGRWNVRAEEESLPGRKTVIAQQGNEALVFVEGSSNEPYAIGRDYDPSTRSWATGEYFSDLVDAIREFQTTTHDDYPREDAREFDAMLGIAESRAEQENSRLTGQANSEARSEAIGSW